MKKMRNFFAQAKFKERQKKIGIVQEEMQQKKFPYSKMNIR